MTFYSNLELRAARFAHEKHKNQTRKHPRDGRPLAYITHPAAVADIVRDVMKHVCTDNEASFAIAAAWLHDVVEDCGVRLSEIDEEFSPIVADLVKQLTEVATAATGNRAARVAANIAHSSRGDAVSQTIKMADLIHNSYRMYVYAPKFADTFFAERKQLIDALPKAHLPLREFAQSQGGSAFDDFKYEHAQPSTLYLLL